MRRLALVLAGLLAAVGSAQAERARIITPASKAQMKPAMRKNVRASVLVGDSDGSGVVLDRARGLIATNAHVAEEAPAVVRTSDGTIVPVREVIHAGPDADVAFLRVGRLPKGTTDVTVDTANLGKQQRVYGIASAEGFVKADRVLGGQHVTDPKRFVRAHRKQIAPGSPTGAPLIALAEHLLANQGNVGYHVLTPGRVVTPEAIGVYGETQQTVVRTSMPNAPSASGGGVFSADSDAMVALHVGGEAKRSQEIPMRLVVEAAKDGVAKGAGSKRGLAALKSWLAGVAPTGPSSTP